MNKNLLITLSLILLGGLTACNAVASLAQEVTSPVEEIADFDLPDSYQAEFSTNLMGYSIEAFSPGDGHSHLYLIQASNAEDGAKLVGMVNQLVPSASDPQSRMRVIETRVIMVRGDESKLVISEGTNSEGKLYRQAMVTFEGHGGPALLVLSVPESAWDEASMEALIASIQ